MVRYSFVLLSTMRLHYYEKEAIVDRHVTGTARNGVIPEHLGKGSLNSEPRALSLLDSIFVCLSVKTESI